MNTVLAAGMLVIMGLGISLVGSIKLPWARRANLHDDQIGWLVTTFGLTTIPVPFLAGWLNDHFGSSPVALVGCVLMLIGLAMIQTSGRFSTCIVAMVVFTTGWIAVGNVANSLVDTSFSENDLRSVAIGNMLFAVGAWITPTLMVLLLNRLGFRGALSVLMGAITLLALLLLSIWMVAPDHGLPGPSIWQEHEHHTVSDDWLPGRQILQDSFLWWSALAIAAYGTLESVTSAWATTAHQQRGATEQEAERRLSSYFFAFLLGRSSLALAGHLLPPATWPLVAVSILVVGVTLWTWSTSEPAAKRALLAMGFGVGMCFPTLLTIFLNYFPDHQHGRSIGWLFTLAAIGWSIFPVIYAKHCNKVGVVPGLRWLLVPALVLLFLVTLGPFSPWFAPTTLGG